MALHALKVSSVLKALGPVRLTTRAWEDRKQSPAQCFIKSFTKNLLSQRWANCSVQRDGDEESKVKEICPELTPR